MLFLKELKKICFSFVYVIFVALLLFGWHENFYGLTEKEIAAAKGNTDSAAELPGSSLLQKPEKEAEYYGMKHKEVPEKIICGAVDSLIIEYKNNSYATYPYTYYKEIVLSKEEQKEILSIICEITGLNEKQIANLPDGYFPTVNGNIYHSDAGGEESDGSFTFPSSGKTEYDKAEKDSDFTKHFIPQVSYERFQELMKKAERIIGKGSGYSMENLRQYYGLSEMTYEEALEEYNKTIYDDKVSTAFARLFCDYITRSLGLYPVFIAVVLWQKDRRNQMSELINAKQISAGKLTGTRYAALLTAVMLPTTLLSFESLAPLMRFSAETGIAVDPLAFLKYIVWWLLPTAMIVTALGMFLTILTSTPVAILVQFIWWFFDTAVTGLSGDTGIFTLMVRHNTLNGSELISRDFALICLNRGLMVMLSLVFTGFSVMVYNKKRGGKWNHESFGQKYSGFFKSRFSSYLPK